MLAKWFSGAAQKKAVVGIELQAEALAVATVKRSAAGNSDAAGEDVANNRSKNLEVGDVTVMAPSHSEAKLDEMLAAWVAQKELKHAPCNLVLAQGEYQVLLVEAPDVAEKELRQAIRWRIKDLISIRVEDAAIEVFLLPKDGGRSGKQMAYVVALEMERVKSAVALIRASGLELVSIDIGELALRNLVCLKETIAKDTGRGVALVRLVEGKGIVSIYRKGNLYLSRQFKIDFGGGLLDDIPVESFLLEVQRSLDYYERQMGQVPPASLYVCGDNISEDKITADLTRGLSVPVKYLNIRDLVSVSERTEDGLLNVAVVALGAAMREFTQSLFLARDKV